jgi:hypothetical protein
MTHSVAIQPHYRALASGLLCLLVLVISSSASSKDFYKWQDDDGLTHYSAHPPRNQRPAEKVRATNTTGTPAPTKEPASRDKPEAETEQVTTSKKNSESCAIAQKNLKTLQERARVRIKEGGSFRYLTPVEKQDMEKSSREKIKEAC